jgi:hypothetical protein
MLLRPDPAVQIPVMSRAACPCRRKDVPIADSAGQWCDLLRSTQMAGNAYVRRAAQTQIMQAQY